MAIEGIDDLKKMLNDFAPRQAEQILRGTTQALATRVAKDIRARAPKGLSGRLKKARNIRAVRRRPVGSLIFSDVRADPRDAFFWRFVEHGTLKTPAQPFVNPVIESEKPKMQQEYRDQFMKRYAKALAKRAGGRRV